MTPVFGKYPISRRWLLLLLLIALPLLADDGYRFTFDNPSVGAPDAPFVLEYFSVVDCSPCRSFEVNHLDQLLAQVDQGTVRIVFRDMPPAAAALHQAIQIFCLQEFPDFVARRIAGKRLGQAAPPLPDLRNKARARYSACLKDAQPAQIMTHNQEAFEHLGFLGTPSFTLSARHHDAVVTRHFARPIDLQQLIDAMHDLTGANVTTQN